MLHLRILQAAVKGCDWKLRRLNGFGRDLDVAYGLLSIHNSQSIRAATRRHSQASSWTSKDVFSYHAGRPTCHSSCYSGDRSFTQQIRRF